MKINFKSILKIVIVIAMAISFGLSLGYSISIKTSRKTATFYFENNVEDTSKVDILKDYKDNVDIVGFKEINYQTVINEDLNRSTSKAKILFTKGKSTLLTSNSSLFEDDYEGCLIDKETAYELFKSTNVINKKIKYNDRYLIIRGIHSDNKANVIMNFPKNEVNYLDGITLDSSNLSKLKLEQYKLIGGFSQDAISGQYYDIFTKSLVSILPITIILLLTLNIISKVIQDKNKPIKVLIYICLLSILIFIFIKILNINIKAPLDMIPNKWSDFEFWSNLWKEEVDKLQQFMYMKKYGVDIFKINNLLLSSFYSIASITLFIISLRFINIDNIKKLFVFNLFHMILIFSVILYVYSKTKFNINYEVIWCIIPLYYLGIYLTKKIQNY